MEKILITKVVRTENTRADLYGKGHRWPDLKLFDLGELAAVGLDPASLPLGEEVPCRFMAYFTYSKKLNKEGNPYKDIERLEALDQPATVISTDTSPILAELKAIREELTATRALVKALVMDRGLDIEIDKIMNPDTSALDEAFPRYQDGSAPSDNETERDTFNLYVQVQGHAPGSVAQLREWYKKQSQGVGQ